MKYNRSDQTIFSIYFIKIQTHRELEIQLIVIYNLSDLTKKNKKQKCWFGAALTSIEKKSIGLYLDWYAYLPWVNNVILNLEFVIMYTNPNKSI